MNRRRKHDILQFQEHFTRGPTYTTILTQAQTYNNNNNNNNNNNAIPSSLEVRNTVASSYNPFDSMDIQCL
jgi:hypothetical protein